MQGNGWECYCIAGQRGFIGRRRTEVDFWLNH